MAPKQKKSAAASASASASADLEVLAVAHPQLALPAPFATSELPTVGSNPRWTFADLFMADPTAIYKIKCGLADALGVHFANINMKKPIADDVDGIPALTEDILSAATVNSVVTISTVVSICHVAWPTSGMNKGYVERWADENVRNWDSSIERRAGAFDAKCQLSGQEFVTTNSHSLMALAATAVKEFLNGPAISPPVMDACRRLRVLLFTTASASEIGMMNATENVEQHERKRHSEVDNIMQVKSWMGAMERLGVLSNAKAVDVFKFALTLRHR
jgi:hypothetical protein